MKIVFVMVGGMVCAIGGFVMGFGAGVFSAKSYIEKAAGMERERQVMANLFRQEWEK